MHESTKKVDLLSQALSCQTLNPNVENSSRGKHSRFGLSRMAGANDFGEKMSMLIIEKSRNQDVFQELNIYSDCMFLSCQVRVSEWVHTL